METLARKNYLHNLTCSARKIEFAFLLLVSFLLASAPAKAQMWISGYYVDTSLYMSDVPFSKLTHAIHFSINPSDNYGTLSGIPGANADAFTSAAHAAGTKAILCLGDNNGSSSLFSSSITNNLSGFISNLVNFINAHNYDGIDLDWEAGSFTGADQSKYISLVNGLRSALGSSKSISIAVYWNGGLEKVVQGSASSLNQVNIMCYDMDQWRTSTYHNNATYLAPGDTTSTSCAAEAAQFSSYIAPAKIGLGIPFYGRITSGCTDSSCSDGLHDVTQTWYGSASLNVLTYKDLIASSYWSLPHGWDSVRGSSYISVNNAGAANDRFISFTDSQQINAIVQLAKSKGYGGVMEFEVEYDFVSSQTGDARHPLAAATYAAVGGTQTTSTTTPPVISGGSPSGTLSSTTTQVTMSVTTNVNAACKYSLTAGTTYSSMAYKFSTTGGTASSTLLTNITSGTSYSYFVRCSDTLGNVDATDYPISFLTAAATFSAPTAVGVTPNSGSGSSQTFAFQLSDPSGAAAIVQTDAIFDTAVGKTSSCWVEFSPSANTLFLRSDDNSTWSQAALGSSVVLKNSQCSVNPAASSVSASGTTQTLSLAMTFAAGFAGTKNLFAFVADSALSSGWQTLGTWTVTAPVVSAISVQITPNSGNSLATTRFTMTINDTNGYSTVQQADLWFATALGAKYGCWIEYWAPTNTLYLRSDDNSTVSSAVLGSSTSLRNSHCTVDPSNSTVSGSGSTLTLSIPVKLALSKGTSTIFTYAGDSANLTTGWQASGIWTR